MPIHVNNVLPSICLHLGLIEDEETKMKMLFDTSATMNHGNLTYHLYVISQCLEMVGKFIQCGAETDYATWTQTNNH